MIKNKYMHDGFIVLKFPLQVRQLISDNMQVKH